jgi:hypothetical protein
MQTQSCMYMVSLQKMEGTALSMAKNRIISPIHAKCVLMIHIQHSRYRVIPPGIVFCWAHGIGLGTVTPHLRWEASYTLMSETFAALSTCRWKATVSRGRTKAFSFNSWFTLRA